jgi:hypothetical protein
MQPHDYKRFLNFLSTHDCGTDFREFRAGVPEVGTRPSLVLPLLKLPPKPAAADAKPVETPSREDS